MYHIKSIIAILQCFFYLPSMEVRYTFTRRHHMLYYYVIVYMYSCTDIPTIETPHSSITAKVSTDVTLAVTVHGTYPQISSVVWTKNGNNIAVSGSKYVGGSVQQPNLTIKSVDVNDDGTYTCTISNGIGYASVDVSLLSWST